MAVTKQLFCPYTASSGTLGGYTTIACILWSEMNNLRQLLACQLRTPLFVARNHSDPPSFPPSVPPASHSASPPMGHCPDHHHRAADTRTAGAAAAQDPPADTGKTGVTCLTITCCLNVHQL